MEGSKNSAILFFISGFLLLIQMGISIAIFDDGIGALASGGFAFVMFLTMLMAYKGGLSAVTQSTVSDGPGYRTTTTWDTGERIQLTPCCGVCGGIMMIVVAMIFAETMLDDALLALSPTFLAAIAAFIASIVFVLEYKGPWTGRAF